MIPYETDCLGHFLFESKLIYLATCYHISCWNCKHIVALYCELCDKAYCQDCWLNKMYYCFNCDNRLHKGIMMRLCKGPKCWVTLCDHCDKNAYCSNFCAERAKEMWW